MVYNTVLYNEIMGLAIFQGRLITYVVRTVLKNGSKCSFTTCKLRFFAVSCLALTASPTLFSASLSQ